MNTSSLPAALRAGANGLHPLEPATGLIIPHAREDFASFIPTGTSMAGEQPQEPGT